MPTSHRMSALELRASLSLSGVYALRMLGIFLFMPVFMPYAAGLPGSNPALAGIAFGMFALVQSCLLIAFGMWSDKVGRKRVIYIGLALFALGSFIAAFSTHIYGLIFARGLQGTGAISAVLTALLADLTREEHRTKAMAMIGGSIGVTFAISLVAASRIEHFIGVPGMFILIGVLAISAGLGVRYVVPNPKQSRFHGDAQTNRNRLPGVLKDPQLLRLNMGVLALHAAQAAMFTVLPFVLLNVLKLPISQQWQIYLPAALVGFVLMVPAILYGEKRRQIKRVFLVAIMLMAWALVGMAYGLNSWWHIMLWLSLYFVAFNILEASLPSLISKLAPVDAKGTAMGVQNTAQSIGFALGSGIGGIVYSVWGVAPTFMFCALLVLVWLAVAITMRPPLAVSTKLFHISDDWQGDVLALMDAFKACPGVVDVAVSKPEAVVYLKVAQTGWNEAAVRAVVSSTWSSEINATSPPIPS